MKTGMLAIIKKDLKGLTANNRMFLALLVVPLVFTVVVPTIFILVIHFAPSESSDFQKLLELLPTTEQSGDLEQTIIGLFFNHILPVFFLIIPIMAASVMSASSFVGEKEKHTLETLLYCPLSLKQIFRSKVLASFLLSMTVSVISFVVMLIVLECEVVFTTGSFLLPDVKWLLIMLLLSPAISMIAITLIVRISAKAQSVEDAQQGAVFLLLPILLLVIGQFTGILLINGWVLLGMGVLCVFLAYVLMKKAMGNFSYELLLK